MKTRPIDGNSRRAYTDLTKGELFWAALTSFQKEFGDMDFSDDSMKKFKAYCRLECRRWVK
jgi:hypothetical protein